MYLNILPDISAQKKDLSLHVEKEIHKNIINSKWWAASEQAIFYIKWQNYLGDAVRLAQKCVLLEKNPSTACALHFYFDSQ